jgi:uncharacterized protein (DUF488 family)
MNIVYTIGHSTHPIEAFIELLIKHKITALCDVRSNPYSRYNPQFNREALQKSLQQHRIAYVYLGKELGPRREEIECYEGNRISYEKIALTQSFQDGLNRLRKGVKTHRIAMMCAEKDPIACHRMILICRNLREGALEIWHILEDGSLENNQASEKRLLAHLKLASVDLFRTENDLIQDAYRAQGVKIAQTVKEED